jgi:hypothetical protein
MERSNERRLDSDYDGDVLLWDIDKTYLDTAFSSWRGLLAIPFELAVDKRAVPGAVPLLRALRRGTTRRSAMVPLYFVSGSPPQLRRVIQQKMTIDGVEFDGITFKDQFGLARRGRLKDIKAQVGYKLTALLLYREELPQKARWLLFGDDVESDATIFSLFGEICADLRGEALGERLDSLGVPNDHADRIREIAEDLPIGPNPVERIFIHLASGQKPESLLGDARVVPTRSFLQTALVLAEMGRITRESVSAVADNLRRHQIAETEIEALLEDAARRLGVTEPTLALARSS